MRKPGSSYLTEPFLKGFPHPSLKSPPKPPLPACICIPVSRSKSQSLCPKESLSYLPFLIPAVIALFFTACGTESDSASAETDASPEVSANHSIGNPGKTVTVDSFYIDESEVMGNEYQEFNPTTFAAGSNPESLSSTSNPTNTSGNPVGKTAPQPSNSYSEVSLKTPSAQPFLVPGKGSPHPKIYPCHRRIPHFPWRARHPDPGSSKCVRGQKNGSAH